MRARRGAPRGCPMGGRIGPRVGRHGACPYGAVERLAPDWGEGARFRFFPDGKPRKRVPGFLRNPATGGRLSGLAMVSGKTRQRSLRPRVSAGSRPGALLIPQRRDGVNLGRPAGRDSCGEQSHRQHHYYREQY